MKGQKNSDNLSNIAASKKSRGRDTSAPPSKIIRERYTAKHRLRLKGKEAIVFREGTAIKKGTPYTDFKFDWKENDFQMPGRNALIGYQVHVGTFFGSYDEKTGRFKKICEKMRYLQALGINALELVLVFDFSGAAHWGYDPSHPFAIEKSHGGPRVLADLVDTAHRHGIAVIIKLSFPHLGTKPYPGKREIQKYLGNHVYIWFETFRVDGIRIGLNGLGHHVQGELTRLCGKEDGLSLLRDISGEIRSRFPQKLLIADGLQGGKMVTKPIAEGGAAFDAQWDHGFMQTVRNVLRQPHDGDRCLATVAGAMESMTGNDAFDRVICCECHDAAANGFLRLPEEIRTGQGDTLSAQKRSILGAVLLLTAPGIPMLFQGQEFLSKVFCMEDTDPDWEKLSQCRGTARLFADLIRFRKSYRPLYSGLQDKGIEFIHFNQTDKVLAYTRFHTDRPNFKVLAVLNFSGREFKQYSIGVPCTGRWKLVFNSNAKEYDPMYSNLPVSDFEAGEKAHGRFPCSGAFGLPAYSALLFIKYGS